MFKIDELMKQAAKPIEDEIKELARKIEAEKAEAKRFDWQDDESVGD